MALNYDTLKARQRNERDTYPESISLRIHRALSWLDRAEQCEDEDGRFIFLWIAFNAAYANELGSVSITEGAQFNHFLSRLVELDTDNKIYQIIWKQYTGAIRVLLDNHYIYQPFWNFHNGRSGAEDWKEQFSRDKAAAHRALAANETGKILGIIFNRLYTLRNQLVHGGATWGSKTNRNQLRDGNQILGDLVPIIIELLMNNTLVYWGDACYPVVD